MTMKFENTASVGDIIKAFDFKPMADRGDCYIVGEVIGYASFDFSAFKVRVMIDVQGGKVVNDEGSRVGTVAFVPYQVSFQEYDQRVTKI